MFPEIGRVKKKLSLTRPLSRLCIKIHIFNFRKQQTNKTKQKSRKAKKTKKKENISGKSIKKINLWAPGWRFFGSPAFPGNKSFFLVFYYFFLIIACLLINSWQQKHFFVIGNGCDNWLGFAVKCLVHYIISLVHYLLMNNFSTFALTWIRLKPLGGLELETLDFTILHVKNSKKKLKLDLK